MSELIVSRQQRVLLLTLNRPAARNALNNALLMQLVNELEAAATDTSISVCVITGNARFFAAGADLNEMAEKNLAATLNDTRPQLWARLQAFNKPLIAAVNGTRLVRVANWHCCAMWWLPERTRVLGCRKSLSASCLAQAERNV